MIAIVIRPWPPRVTCRRISRQTLLAARRDIGSDDPAAPAMRSGLVLTLCAGRLRMRRVRWEPGRWVPGAVLRQLL